MADATSSLISLSGEIVEMMIIIVLTFQTGQNIHF